MKEIVYTLSMLMEIAQRGINQTFYGFNFWFKSEISRINIVKGYVYLDLIEIGDNSKVLSKIKGIIFDLDMWENTLKEINIKNNEIVNYQFMFNGKFNFHKEYGLSIIINKISKEHILGQKTLNQISIKNYLIEKKIYQNNKKLSLGFPPYKIAIISSQKSSGLNDFIAIIKKNNFLVQIDYYFGDISGNNAKESVFNQFQLINNSKIMYNCIILLRGGGESQGLQWQNDLKIAEIICKINIPVILAIGHSTDTSILDEIVYYSAFTPSNAAHFILQRYESYSNDLSIIMKEILHFSNQKIENYKQGVEKTFDMINNNIKFKLNYLKENLKELYKSINSIKPENLTEKGYALIYNTQGKIMNKKEISSLKKGDLIEIRIYNKKIKLQIV